MARIRSIKPEFWTSEQVMECSLNARLLFIGMWNFADDLGRLPLSVKTIKASVFPGDDIALDIVRGMIDELSKNGLILTYVVEDREYLQVTGWQHQRIDKPQAGKCPSPVNGYSKSIRGTIPPDRNGKEGNGIEKDAVPAERTPAASPPDPEKDLFDRGKQVLGKSAGGQIAKLLKAKGGNVALARAAIEQASTKQDSSEYIGAVIRGSTGSPQFAERETNGFATRLKNRHQENTDAAANREPIDVTPNQPGGQMGAERRAQFDGRARLHAPAGAGSPGQTFEVSGADGELPLAGPG